MHVEIRTEYISEWYHIASSPNCKPAINGLHKFRVPFTDSLAIQRMNIKLINDKKEEGVVATTLIEMGWVSPGSQCDLSQLTNEMDFFHFFGSMGKCCFIHFIQPS